MFSNLLRQQARLAFSTRLTVPLRQQSQKSVLALSTQKSQILSQRTFSISRSLFEEALVAPLTQKPAADATSRSQTANTREAQDAAAHEQRVLYVGNLPFSAEEEEIRKLFEPYGEVAHVRLMSDADGRQRGYGFVEFQSAQALAAAVESGAEEPFVLLNRSLRVSVAQGPTRTQRASREKDLGEPTSTIHIANYPMPGDDRPLRQMLGEYSSKIMRVSFMKDFNGNNTEKAFVQFKDTTTAATVLEEFQEMPLEGTNLKLYYSKERTRGSRAPRPRERSRNHQSYDA